MKKINNVVTHTHFCLDNASGENADCLVSKVLTLDLTPYQKAQEA